jgi:hypothetical protein
MLRHLIIPALSAITLTTAAAAWAQSSPTPSAAKDDDTLAQRMAQKIRDELTSQGFKDLKVIPSSFLVSGKDSGGKSVMLVIGPNSTMVLTPSEPGSPYEEQNPKQGGMFQQE